jgi:hypothetical protein
MKEIKGIARVKFLPGKVEEWEAPDGAGDGDRPHQRLKAEPVRGTGEHFNGTLQYDLPVLAMPPA